MGMIVEIKVISDGKTYVGNVELSPASSRKPLPAAKLSAGPDKTAVTKPSEAVHILYEKGFFATGRRLGEVVEELQKVGYNFSRPSIFMFLKSANFLQVRGKKGSYIFVQKYPFAA